MVDRRRLPPGSAPRGSRRVRAGVDVTRVSVCHAEPRARAAGPVEIGHEADVTPTPSIGAPDERSAEAQFAPCMVGRPPRKRPRRPHRVGSLTAPPPSELTGRHRVAAARPVGLLPTGVRAVHLRTARASRAVRSRAADRTPPLPHHPIRLPGSDPAGPGSSRRPGQHPDGPSRRPHDRDPARRVSQPRSHWIPSATRGQHPTPCPRHPAPPTRGQPSHPVAAVGVVPADASRIVSRRQRHPSAGHPATPPRRIDKQPTRTRPADHTDPPRRIETQRTILTADALSALLSAPLSAP